MPDEDAKIPALSKRPLRVLVVEDNDMIGKVIKRALEAQHDRVTWVRSAEEASGTADWPWYDLLLTDLELPGRGGTDLVKDIRPLRPDLQVIFMSGYADRPLPVEEHHRAIFLAKPFSLSKLREVIEQARQNCAPPPPSSPC